MPDLHTPENVEAIPGNRLQYFPIMMFAVTMGLSGLTIAYIKAAELYGIPPIIGQSLVWLVSGIFCLIALTYLLKLILYPAEVKAEFQHPVRINFFAASTISLLLLAIIYLSINRQVAFGLWIVGAVGHLYFTLNTLSFWINRNMEIQHSNPAWFIPIVGNIIVPVAGSAFAGPEILVFFFSVGLFFWIVMTAIIFNRIIFHHQMAAKFTPTLFIFIAPPAVGMVAYYKITHNFDFMTMTLLDLGIFFTFLVLFMFKNFVGLKFFISWWAFTFPMAAVTIAVMLAYHVTHLALYKWLGMIFLAVATLVVGVVAWQTLRHMAKKEICVME